MTAVYPGGSNTYVPELTDKLVVDFSRNINDFPVNKYSQIVPVERNQGYYLKITREEAGRLINSDIRNFLWADGMDRPRHNNEMESFDFVAYLTKRYDFGFNAGYLTTQQAQWNLRAHNAGIKAEQAMRARTQQVITAATTTGTYASSHVSAVNGGSIPNTSGQWDQSTTARKDIKRCLDYAADLIISDTLNGVKQEDLILVMSRGAARKLSLSQEIVDYLKGAAGDALKELYGTLPDSGPFFGLPKKLYGYEIVIEDTQKVTSRKGASSLSSSAILSDNTPFMCSRVGGLVSERTDFGASFSTHTLFMKEEMSVEEFDDPKHRRVENHVVEDYAAVVTAPVSGFLFQSAFSY